MIYIEYSDDGFFQTMREIQNKITKLIGINNAPDFIQYILYENSRYIEVDVRGNTSFAKSYCLEGKIILVLHSDINDILHSLMIFLLHHYQN